MRRLRLTLALAACLAACSNEPLYDNEHYVYFVFDAGLHPASLISRLAENSNCFLTVDCRLDGRVHTLTIQSNAGQTETLRIESEPENRNIRGMGAHNSLILGCTFGTSLGQGSADPYTYVAYDRQCPACLSNHASTSFPLSFGERPTEVVCSTCDRTYNLVAAGISSDGRRLKTYRLRYDKTQRLFIATNQ